MPIIEIVVLSSCVLAGIIGFATVVQGLVSMIKNK